MVQDNSQRAERLRTAAAEQITALLHDAQEDLLLVLLDNPNLGEDHLCLLLERIELSSSFLEEIVRRKTWLRSYRVKRGIAFHPHAPRLIAIRLARQLYLMDLVHLSLTPAVPAELRRLAEELVVARLPQLPLGQKLMLARRSSARVAGALLFEGHERLARAALDNAFLTEAQVLKVLSRARLPVPVVSAIARHAKWSHLYNVRMALVRHPMTPLERVLAFLPDIAMRDLNELCHSPMVPEKLRRYIRHETLKRARTGREAGRRRMG